MPIVTLKQLKVHPAQMRTTYDLEKLATLTLQVYERGLDQWQPIAATPNGEGYHIVSGHRRHMAQLFAFALREWAQAHLDTEITVEVVRTMIHTLVDSLGSLEQVVASLLTKHGDEEITFVTFEGSQKAQILALQAANYGSEQPDMLGVAHSFRQAVAAGATPEEIARNVGQPVQFVRNHLALTEIPPELAQRIAAGELPMSVATIVAEVPEPKRTGLSIFILANETDKLTAKAIKECAMTLKKWPGLQLPMMVKHQSQRNIARALVRLWGQVVEAYPEDAYAAVAMIIYRNGHEEPWATQDKLSLWFQALGGDTYYTNGDSGNRSGGINWNAIVEYLIPDISCKQCPIAQLPPQQLRTDLFQGRGGVLGMPCRAGEEVQRCLHGLAANDLFDVRVPWEWSEHPGVVNEAGEYRVKRYEDLSTAWQAQAAKEQSEDLAEVASANDEQPASKNALSEDAGQRPSTISSQPANDVASPTPPSGKVVEQQKSPVVKQRAQIARFMKHHEQHDVNHPFATSCGRCRHHLDNSPTKDETVPHCAWAGRLRTVSFKLLSPDDKKLSPIPVCRQFAPNQAWREIIPAHPSPPELPRDWFKAQILHLVKAANQHGSSRNAFEFLAGRPMTQNEAYSDWFQQQMASQSGELSAAQLFTLFIWAHSEWQRTHRNEFVLPTNGHGVQFANYREAAWPLTTEAL
ncbi:MAG: ParB N-terminal domain-containing protein [Ardenticatenaceae bacterium]|nr:ParB N-terminal domain-containing protein [Ardenticatenaceae bacterium]